MSDWNRSTKEIMAAAIRPEVTEQLQAHFERFNLASPLGDALMCVETRSDKKKKGLFSGGGDKWTVITAVVTPDWLVIGGLAEKQGAFALSVQLAECSVSDYKDSPNYKLIADSGLQVEGVFTGRVGEHGSQRIGYFIPLGEEAAAEKFKTTLFEALQKVKK